jgi:hypothetical protein
MTDGFLASLALIIGVLSRSRHTQQYTRWNLVLLCLHQKMGIPVQSIFVNSVVTLLAFQHAATNGTKTRLMSRYRVSSPLLFLLADILGHVVPVVTTFALMCKTPNGKRMRIRPAHLFHAYTWFGLYYMLVGRGFNCEKQYVVYPWIRQVRCTALVPLLLYGAWNRDVQRNSWLFRGLLAFTAFYVKEWYDLIDNAGRQMERRSVDIHEETD